VRTAGVLLAAGAGSRFRGPAHKLLTPVSGRALVSHALGNMAASGLAAYCIVTGAADLDGLVPAGVEVVVNPEWEQGQATSLAAGVRWASAGGFDAIVVGLGDQPGVPTSAWERVAACDATPVAVAVYRGRRGNPVRLARSIWPLLPASGDAGARVLMASSPELVTDVACEGDPMDVDTVEDLARW
jgi:molybdenum cofactor cytidylyltransferase